MNLIVRKIRAVVIAGLLLACTARGSDGANDHRPATRIRTATQ